MSDANSHTRMAQILQDSRARKIILDPANTALLRDRFGFPMAMLIKLKARVLELGARATGKFETKVFAETANKQTDTEAGKTASFVEGENIDPEMRKVEQAPRIAQTEDEQRSTAGDHSPPGEEINMRDGEAGEKPASSVDGKLQGEQEKGKNGGEKNDLLIVADKSFLNKYKEIDWEKYAPNGGFIEDTIILNQTLNIGTIFDRYGNIFGHYVCPYGTKYGERSLPYIENKEVYHIYRVIKPIDGVKIGKIAPAFNQPGMGIQYELPYSIKYLLEKNYIEEIEK